MNSFNIITTYTSIKQVMEMYLNTDMLDEDISKDIMINIMGVLKYRGYNVDEINLFNVNLDYNRRTEIYYIMPINLISALWCSDIFPENPITVNEKNVYTVKNKTYTFNHKTRKLIINNAK